MSQEKAMVFMDFTGVNSQDLFSFRNKLKQENCGMEIAKKTLLLKALEKIGKKELLEKIKKIETQIALIFGFKDEIAPSRFAYEAQKGNEKFLILGGSIGDEYLAKEKIIEFAELPSKTELLARFARALKNPVINLHNALKFNLNGFVYILNQKVKK